MAPSHRPNAHIPAVGHVFDVEKSLDVLEQEGRRMECRPVAIPVVDVGALGNVDAQISIFESVDHAEINTAVLANGIYELLSETRRRDKIRGWLTGFRVENPGLPPPQDIDGVTSPVSWGRR